MSNTNSLQLTPVPIPANLPTAPPTPELVKLASQHARSRPVMEFIRWLAANRPGVMPDLNNAEVLCAAFLGIDYDATQREQEALREYLKDLHQSIHGRRPE